LVYQRKISNFNKIHQPVLIALIFRNNCDILFLINTNWDKLRIFIYLINKQEVHQVDKDNQLKLRHWFLLWLKTIHFLHKDKINAKIFEIVIRALFCCLYNIKKIIYVFWMWLQVSLFNGLLLVNCFQKERSLFLGSVSRSQ